jgi:hypothetical protein
MYAAIHTAFDEIRRLFFPRWDRNGAWRLEVSEELLCFGCCDFEKKTITIRPLPAGDGLRLLLAHEICHDCAGRSHGKKWRGRMLMAAAAAAAAGRHDLARMLADEAAAAGAAGANIRAGSVYEAIRSCAADYPTASFDEIKGLVCRRLGLCTEEFEKTYRRARRVFEEISQGQV